MAQLLTDTMIRSLKPGKRKSERVQPAGSLVFWCRKSSKEFYYRKTVTKDGVQSEINHKLGNYPDLSLSVVREKAREIARIAHNVNDLKFYLQSEQERKDAEEAAAKSESERQRSIGTLKDLCDIYTQRLEKNGKSSARKVRDGLTRHVIDAHPLLAQKKANTVTSDDIATIIRTMISADITTTANRIRNDLHAAFNVGLTYDYDPSLNTRDGLIFDIDKNPVARVPTQKSFERQLDRYLDGPELAKVWSATPLYMSRIYGPLLRILVCTGFHPAELLRLRVSQINLDEQSIYMTETKSGVPNLIPLNRFAMDELEQLTSNQEPDALVFPSHRRAPKSDTYARASVLSNQVSKLRKELPDVDHFTPRDIRRTVKTLMGKAGISKEMRDRLQNHSFSDTSSKHYDRYDYWPEKKAAMFTWQEWLSYNVVSPKSRSR